MRLSRNALRAVLAQVEGERDRALERVAELEDRLDSRSLAEFKTFSGPAMPASEPEERITYISDPTGLFSMPAPSSE